MLNFNFQPKLRRLMLSFAGLVLVIGSNFNIPLVSAATPTELTRYVVKLNSNDSSVLGAVGVDAKTEFGFSGSKDFQNIYTFSSTLSLTDLRAKLKGQYSYLDIDSEISIGSTSITPNDPGFTDDELDIKDQWGLPKAKFPEAWKITKGSKTNVVAVLDTGIDATHNDLKKQSFKAGYDFVHDTPIVGKINSDDNGHGTLVSGVIAAVPNNKLGIAGTNWQVTLMPLKALNENGSGTASNVAEAIVWGADNGATVINMSLGGVGFGHDTTLSNAISYAFRKNVIIVAAAGNDAATNGGNLDVDPVFPICDDNGQNMIIGVTATDHNDLKPGFANYGKACIDVTAPGKRILSTINHDPLTGGPSLNSYAYASGTSLAVPFVTGQAALLKAKNPNATNKQIRDAIISTADKVDDLNLSQCAGGSCRGFLGAGRINVLKSLAVDMSVEQINEGDIVKVGNVGSTYYISGGKRHLISPFVKEQRFSTVTPKIISELDLQNFPEGDYATPKDGTLIKIDQSPAIYYMAKGMKMPVTYQVFQMRKFKFSDVHTLSYSEVNSWLVGSFLSPPDGSLVRSGKSPTLYWVVEGVLHPINYEFYVSRGLQIFPTVYVGDEDIKSFSKGEPYIR